MKRFLTVTIVMIMMISIIAACSGNNQPSNSSNSSKGSNNSNSANSGNGDGGSSSDELVTINLWSFSEEVLGMTDIYKKLHPELNMEFNSTMIAATDGAYQTALDQSLAAGGKDAPDIYAVEAGFVLKYTQGDASAYAANYADLGLSDQMVQDAGIAQYSLDIGSKDGELKALGYQATGSGFIYRRSIAEDVFGSSDPDVVKNAIGPGWDKFFDAAEKLKEKDYAIVSGSGDIWKAIENSSDKGWLVDGKLHIDPKREGFLDIAKQMKENNYHNDTEEWSEAWYADMSGTGLKPVFGYLGPAWLINYTLGSNVKDTHGDWAVTEAPTGFFWGGTWLVANKDVTQNAAKKAAVAHFIEWVTLNTSETGLQYLWANGAMVEGEQGTKDTVASSVVMAKSNGELDLLGGQNMFDIFVPANAHADGKNLTQYDDAIAGYWRTQVNEYAAGNKDRDQAIKDFKQQVRDELGIDSE